MGGAVEGAEHPRASGPSLGASRRLPAAKPAGTEVAATGGRSGPVGGSCAEGWESDIAAAALALARRFAAGATLWCLAPEWPAHAHHVAVEFVHPVVVGARALPAVAVDGPRAVETLRALVGPGDEIALIGTASAPPLAEVATRARAWGAGVLWAGAGIRPDAGLADHVLWAGPDPSTAAYDGHLVLTYHVLWELTQVCFEHPGLLRPAAPGAGDGAVCVTCADEGRPAEVVGVAGDLAEVRTPAGSEQVDTTLVGAVSPGELLVVHAGCAIARLAPADDAGPVRVGGNR